ncbi:MAG: ABC transporter ATP-binding protein [archaeon]
MDGRRVIMTEGLTKIFPGRTRAVDSVSLSVEAGSIFGFLGPNGSGKTTTVRLLTGQLKPTSGRALVLGIDPEKEPIKVREAVGIMPEQETPPSFLTSEEYLQFVCKIRGVERAEGAEKKISRWLSFFSLESERDTLCKDLSRGTRQKLMFAQAFIHEPKVAFIDEPLINLDPIVQKSVKEFLTGFAKRGGTVFFCTHVLEVAEKLCTDYGIISGGKLLKTGKISDLRKRGKNLEQVFFSLVSSPRLRRGNPRGRK